MYKYIYIYYTYLLHFISIQTHPKTIFLPIQKMVWFTPPKSFFHFFRAGLWGSKLEKRASRVRIPLSVFGFDVWRDDSPKRIVQSRSVGPRIFGVRISWSAWFFFGMIPKGLGGMVWAMHDCSTLLEDMSECNEIIPVLFRTLSWFVFSAYWQRLSNGASKWSSQQVHVAWSLHRSFFWKDL